VNRALLEPYNPESAADRFRLQEAIVRLHLRHLTRATLFHVDLVDGAWWLAKQAEAAARLSRAS
jgi:hypothetical protein